MGMTGQAALRAGVIGLGNMGWRHAELLTRLAGVDLCAVADVEPARLGEARAAFRVPAYASWEELLDGEGPDVVLVCTPPRQHAGPVLAAIERGMHVFVEKPIARELDDARALAEAARAKGVVAAMGYQWRAIDFLDELRAELATQTIGMVEGRSIGPSLARPWFVSWRDGGGILLELASHDIDLQRALAGEVVSVQAAASDPPIAAGVEAGVPSVMSITMRFVSGALGAIQVAWLAPDLPTCWAVDVVTDEGAFYVALDPDFVLRGRSRGQPFDRVVKRDPREANIVRFLGAARAGNPRAVACDFTDGLQTLAVALACDEALRSGRAIAVDEARTTA
jgi:predicted dehydrogenase